MARKDRTGNRKTREQRTVRRMPENRDKNTEYDSEMP